MKLIIGLGNPGRKYENTWHNLGFLALDYLVQENDFGNFKAEAKFNAETATGKIGREKVILAKPQTWMNNSGLAVLSLAKYYKIKSEDIIVIHDDIDLLLGKIRLAFDSSSGGHNGIKSIIEHLDTKKFIRIKLGVKTERLDNVPAPDYVLEKFGRGNKKAIDEEIKKAASALESAVCDGIEKAMNNFN